MININNPHDRLSKKVLSKRRLAKAFFEVHLPGSLKKMIDLDTLEPTKGTFIDNAMREHLTDILYKTQIHGEQGYLYLLIEAQSTPDRLMPFRILQYMVNVMQQHIDNQEACGEKQTLPLLYPMIYYTGERTYNYSTDIYDNFVRPELAKQYFLKPYKLIDLSQFSDEELKHHQDIGALELIQKHIYDRDMQLFFDEILAEDFLFKINKIDGNYLDILLKYSVYRGQIEQPKKFIDKIVKAFPEKEETMGTVAEYLKEKGLCEGIREGMREGKLEGMREGKLEGMREGKLEAKLEMAQNLLAMGFEIEKIAQATNFPVEKISALLDNNT